MAKWTLPAGRKPMTDAELASLLRRVSGTAIDEHERVKVLEAKLEQAVEALTRIEDLTCHNMPMTAKEEQCVNREARTTLAELKGQDDE